MVTDTTDRFLAANPIRAVRCQVASAILRRALSQVGDGLRGDRAADKITWAAVIVTKCYEGYHAEDETAETLRDGVYVDPLNGDDSGWVAKHAINACATIFEA